MTEEIDLQKCHFRNFRGSVTLTSTLHRVEVKLVRTSGPDLSRHQIRYKSENFLWTEVRTYVRTDGRTDGRTHLSSVSLLGYRPSDDLKSLNARKEEEEKERQIEEEGQRQSYNTCELSAT